MKRLLPALVVLALLALVAVVALLWSIDPTAPAQPRRARASTPAAHAAQSDPTDIVDASTAQWPEDAPRTVVGTVRDDTGAPIDGAMVQAERGTRSLAHGRTSAKGTYRLTRVPVPIERLVFSARGYQSQTIEHPPLPPQARVTFDVVLQPSLGVRGRVFANGAAAQDAHVVLRVQGQGRVLARDRTDESGRYALDWPGDGAYFVSAYHAQHGQARVAVDEPGAADIELPGGGWVEGRVVDADGAAVPAFSVSASPLTRFSGGPPAQSFDNGAGRFKLGPLAPGKMRVWAVAAGYQPGEEAGITLESGQTISGLVLRLSRSTVLVGQVTDARTGRPIDGASVVPAEWQARALAESVGAYTGPDGRYRLSALPGKRTSIRVTAEGYKRLLVGGVEGTPGDETERDFALSPEDGRSGGELTGIGAVLMRHRDGVRLGRIMQGGPAAEVLSAGDVVTAVNGVSLRGKSIRYVAQAIRGEEGTEVELSVKRNGRGAAEAVVLERSRVSVPSPHRRN
jgi:protocatechuate 3,4-dioxygenase beta subunit